MAMTGSVVVSFRDDGADPPVDVRVGEEMATAIHRAARAGELGAPNDPHRVSFTTLFIGLAAGSDPVGTWLRGQFASTGDMDGLLSRRKLDRPAFGKLRELQPPRAFEPLRRTPSARTALDEGSHLARERGDGTPDTRHVMAAYLSLPTFHEEDFRTLRIDRPAWGRAFAGAMEKEYPGEDWLAWLASAFPPERQDASAVPEVAFDPDLAEVQVLFALAEAGELAGVGPILPSHVLRAIVRVTGLASSQAFQRFARLVPLTTGAATTTQNKPMDPSRLDVALLKQLKRAQQPRPGATEPTSIWGRDLVSAALLASDEPASTVAEAGRTLGEIRDAWFGFVTSSADHRSPDEWHAWWSECGVPLPGEQRSGFSLETASGTDQLGIEDEASAFARLILDRKVQAPLSIGLLGDWGSGKSFFIEQIKQQIAAIKKQPRPELYSDLIEIEFNAWHASDANLWASLVTHIFDAIWDQVAPSVGSDVNAAREDLVARIQVAQGAVHEAEAQVAAGEQAVATAVQTLEAAKSELGWDDHVMAVTKIELRELARRAGWDESLDTIQDVREATRELAASGGRLRAAANALMDRPIRRIAIPTVLLATATAALWLLLRDGSVAAQLARWSGSAAAAIGTVVVPLRLGGHKLAKLASTLERIRDEYDETIEGLSAEERAALADREAKLAAAEEQLKLAKQHLEKLIAEHTALDPRRRLGAFLEERVQSTVYRAQQGIISLVRKDFERLSELMRNLRGEPARGQLTDAVAKQVLEADLEAQIKPFDRIVLYVDDLDRCRPAHVVNMLEAVHLLLALDLFIVVVAVDSRWLTRALEVHYKELLTVHGDDDDVRVSTPQNYLEKIFQVTYALGPMDPTHFGKYVRSLAGEESAAQSAPPITQTEETPASGEPASEQPASRETVQATEVVQTAKTDDAGTPKRASASEAPTVRIDDAEKKVIEGLVPLLPTPRIAKRLVNVYRLIKSSMNSGAREQFESKGRPASCLLVLAILFGRPALAGELLRGLNERTPPFEDDQRTLVEAVKARQAPAGEPTTLTAEWARLAATLEAMKVTATVGACRREPLTVARYSLVTGHEWHTWRRA